jgi:hypothetical protein
MGSWVRTWAVMTCACPALRGQDLFDAELDAAADGAQVGALLVVEEAGEGLGHEGGQLVGEVVDALRARR